jgi:hypothetical protein
MKKLALLTLLWVTFLQVSHCQPIPADSLYLGQTPPGSTPTIFAPNIISISGRREKVITFSPDGQCLFFSYGIWPNCKTMIMEYKNNRWSKPEIASFSKTRSVDEPIFSPDGKRIYYYAYNSPNSVGGADICYSVRNDSTWSEPINVGNSLNTSSDEYHPCVVNDSSIYFENTSGVMYRSQYINGSYQPKTMLPSPITHSSAWGDCYVSPDESYIIFTSSRSGGFGGNDDYISYRLADGSWTNPRNLGNKINTSANESGGDITADGKYLMFWRNDDIYWVSASFIDSIKQTIDNPSSLEQMDEQNIQIYPNPSNGLYKLSLGTSQKHEALMEIYNLKGEILVKTAFKNTRTATIDLRGYSTGIYIIKLNIDGDILNRKIVVE